METQWLAGGLAIISLALLVCWHWLKNRSTRTEFWQKLEQRWISRPAEFFYFVGLPYLTLITGVLRPQLLGLKGLEYFALLSTNSLIPDIQKAVMLMLVEWLLDSGAMMTAGLMALIVLGGIALGLAHYGIKQATSPASVVDTVYRILHWAFYWAIFWLITDDLYLGVVLGTSWVILEWVLVAHLQKNRLVLQPQRLIDVILLILTAAIFYSCPNLWLLWPIHLAMVALTRTLFSTVATPETIEDS
jgi:hypothetical protein